MHVRMCLFIGLSVSARVALLGRLPCLCRLLQISSFFARTLNEFADVDDPLRCRKTLSCYGGQPVICCQSISPQRLASSVRIPPSSSPSPRSTRTHPHNYHTTRRPALLVMTKTNVTLARMFRGSATVHVVDDQGPVPAPGQPPRLFLQHPCQPYSCGRLCIPPGCPT